MTSIEIRNGKAVTTERANLRWYSIKRQLEGRTSLDKNGVVKFEASKHNLETWKCHFPDAEIKDIDSEIKAFEDFTVAERSLFFFKTKPFPHQEIAFEKLKDLDYVSILAEQGLGKSALLSYLISYKYCNGLIDAAIILSPKGVHYQWVEEQLPTHLSVPFAAWAWDKRKTEVAKFEKEVLPSNDLQVLSLNIDAIKTKEGFRVISEFIKKHNGRVFLAVDEAHGLKNAASGRSKVAIDIGSKCRFRAILTGTPIAKNIEDIFGEYKFLDDRVIGTKYISSFRAQYCEQRSNGFGMVTVGAKNLDALYAKIDPVTFRATKAELDLPPQLYDTRHFEMSTEQKKAYADLKKNYMLQFSEDQTLMVKHAASAIMKLQQISCGWLKMEDGSFIDFPNPRLEVLKEILDNIEGPVVIWSNFTRDIHNIMNTLGNDAVSYYGDTSNDDRDKAKKDFLAGNVKYFVSNPAAGGTGLNLQGRCTDTIFYSNSYNAVNRWQAESRIHRIGTKGACTYIDLICRGSVDARILTNLRDKRSLSDLAIDEIRKMFQ